MVQTDFIGRDNELAHLKSALEDAIAGKGSTILISGEAGIGKTRLVEEFRNIAGTKDVKILSGAAAADTIHPFLIFSKALEGEMDRPLFHEQDYTSFTEIFAVDAGGLLVAKAAPEEEELDADIFAGMLSAVQSFVRDSFDSTGKQNAGLGRLEYGDMKILIEHGKHIFLTAVVRGNEHPDMKNLLRNTVRTIEEKYGGVLRTWSGKMEDVGPIQEVISSLAGAKFLVRRDMEGVKLENERMRIADRTLELLVEMADAKPLIILLEDLHWAEESSLFVLNYLARNVKKERILILGTLRPKESETLQKTVGEMIGEDIVNEMNLEMLGNDSVVSLINEIYSPNEFSSDFMENMAGQCDGNPFFVIEMLRQMRAEGNIAEEGGRFVLINEDYIVPASVEDVVHRRLDMLEPDAMTMAEYSSCIGREFERAAAFSLGSLRDAPSALKKLEAVGIVTTDNGTAEFGHAIFQDVIYRSIGGRWKAAYHKSLGEYYEDACRNRPDDVLYDLARHFSRSGEHQKAFDYCYRAGEKAENAFAAEQAVEFYDSALTALPKLRRGQPETELAILERLGDIFKTVSMYERSLDVLDTLLEKETDIETRARIHRKKGLVLELTGKYNEAMREFESGRKALGAENSVEFGRILSCIGLINENQGDSDDAVRSQNEALRMLESFEDVEMDIANVLYRIGVNHYYRGEFDEAFGYYQESLELKERLNDLSGISNALRVMGILSAQKGDYDKALEYTYRCLEMKEKLGDIRGLGMTLNNIGVILMDMGEWDAALEKYEESLRIGSKVGDASSVATALNNLGEIFSQKGEYDKAIDRLQECIEISESVGDRPSVAYAAWCLGKAFLKSGDVVSAEENALKALDIAYETSVKETQGKALRLLGMIFTAKEEWEQAESHYWNSIETTQDAGIKRGLVESYIELGRMLKIKGEPGRGREQLETALKLFEEMGLEHEMEDVRRELED